MKQMQHTLLSLSCFALLTTLAACAATQFDVYLLAGQSNMDGRGQAKDLSDDQRRPSEKGAIFYRNPPISTEGWMPLVPGFSIPPGYKKKTLPSPTFGPEIGFAAAMTKAQPGRRFALIKSSKGGTSLSKDWNPGAKGQPDTQGPCYRNCLETVALATKALTNDGSTLTWRGVLWHQGESDAGSATEVYQRRLTDFIARLRDDLGHPNLPVVIGEVFDNGKRDSVRAAQRAVAKVVTGVSFIAADGTKTWDAGTHFDAASQLLLGERFATAVLQLSEYGSGSR